MKKTLLGHFYALLVTILVALSFISSAKLARIVNPISLTFLRFIIASSVLVPIIVIQNNWVKELHKVAWQGGLIGLLYAVYFISFFTSLESTTTLHTGTLYTLVPLLTAGFSIFIFKQPLSKLRFIVYLIGAVGTAWVIFDGNLKQLMAFKLNDGDYLFMIAVLATCGYSLFMKALVKDNFNISIFIFSVLGSGAIWMGAAMLLFDKPLNWERITGSYIFHISYLAIGATVMSFWFYQKAILQLDPNKATAYIYLTPAFVAIFAYLFKLESFPNLSVQIGIVVSIVATLLLQFDRNTLKKNVKSKS